MPSIGSVICEIGFEFQDIWEKKSVRQAEINNLLLYSTYLYARMVSNPVNVSEK